MRLHFFNSAVIANSKMNYWTIYSENGLFGLMNYDTSTGKYDRAFDLFMKCSTVCDNLSPCIMFTWSRFQFLPLCAVARVTDWQAAPNTAIMGFLKYRELYSTSVACPGSHWSKRNSTYLPRTLTQIPWLTTISVLLTISAHDTWSRKEKVMSTDKMKNQRRNACFKLV